MYEWLEGEKKAQDKGDNGGKFFRWIALIIAPKDASRACRETPDFVPANEPLHFN